MIQISVVIPTFNRKTALEQAIRSVLAQRKADFEIIVADDGSTDGTAACIRQKFPQVRYLRWEKQQGPSYARNRGVEEAKGPWIAFLDSDDEWKLLENSVQAAIWTRIEIKS